MKLAFSIIFLTILSTCIAQHRERLISSDSDRMRLKGKVSTLSHLDYDLIEDISDTSSMRIDHFFLSPNNYVVEFNTHGNIVKKTEFEYLYSNDTLRSKGKWTYSYDSLNRIIKEVYYWNNSSNDTTLWTYEYLGDSVTLIDKYDDTYKHMRYRYAQRDNIEYLTTANSDSSYLTRILFVYDRFNRIIRKEEYEDQPTMTHIRSWRYIDSLSVNAALDVSISLKHNYGPVVIINEYDSLQNVTLSSRIGNQKPSLIEYDFDALGNWTERRTLLPNGFIKISRRRIEYYQ